jgi:hypothetical protein
LATAAAVALEGGRYVTKTHEIHSSIYQRISMEILISLMAKNVSYIVEGTKEGVIVDFSGNPIEPTTLSLVRCRPTESEFKAKVQQLYDLEEDGLEITTKSTTGKIFMLVIILFFILISHSSLVTVS